MADSKEPPDRIQNDIRSLPMGDMMTIFQYPVFPVGPRQSGDALGMQNRSVLVVLSMQRK
ncbi:hypothetical protein D3C75_1335190 [compost metagenome]